MMKLSEIAGETPTLEIKIRRWPAGNNSGEDVALVSNSTANSSRSLRTTIDRR